MIRLVKDLYKTLWYHVFTRWVVDVRTYEVNGIYVGRLAAVHELENSIVDLCMREFTAEQADEGRAVLSSLGSNFRLDAMPSTFLDDFINYPDLLDRVEQELPTRLTLVSKAKLLEDVDGIYKKYVQCYHEAYVDAVDYKSNQLHGVIMTNILGEA